MAKFGDFIHFISYPQILLIRYYYKAEMTPEQPIQILSDNEEEEIFKTNQANVIQKMLEDEAFLTNSRAGLMIAVNMQSVEGTPQEKEKRIKDRIKKMFFDKNKFDISRDHFCVRREPNYGDPACKLEMSELLVFGTDFWLPPHIQADAQAINIKVQAIKVDDSHTKLKFPSNSDVKRWLDFYEIKKVAVGKMEEQAEMEDMGSQNQLKGWFALQNYNYQGFERPLEARFCTNMEQNLEAMKEETQYAMYQKFKQDLEELALSNQKAVISYQMAEERNRLKRKNIHRQSLSNSFQKSQGVRQRQRGARDFYSKSRQPSRSRDKSQHRRRRSPSFLQYKSRDPNATSPNPHPDITLQSALDPRVRTQLQDQQRIYQNLHQSNVLDSIPKNPEVDNLSFLLQSSNNDDHIHQITNAMNHMELEDLGGEDSNMSVEIGPAGKASKKVDEHNMSLFIEEKPKGTKLKKNPRKVSENQEKSEAKGQQRSRIKKPPKILPNKPEKSEKIEHKSQDASQFDYIRYLAEQEQRERAQKE